VPVRESVVRVAGLVQLRTYLTAGAVDRVDVRVRLARVDRAEELGPLAGAGPLCTSSSGARNRRRHVSGRDRPTDRSRLRARLNSGRPVAEIRAQEHRDAAVDASLSEVDVRLRHRALEPSGGG